MSRHLVSSVCLGLAILAGLGTSRASVELEARITRSDQAVIILNDSDFEWRLFDVEVRDPEDYSRTRRFPVEVLGPGESIRVSFEHMSGAGAQASDLVHMPHAQWGVFVYQVEDGSFGYTPRLTLSEIPLEKTPNRTASNPSAEEERR